jgi:DNA-binding CsgD family transcriptional regulator
LKNSKELTNSGLPAVGRLPWGSHLCIFYQTKRDLLDILVPYFAAGLDQNEFCLWVVDDYEFLDVATAKSELRRVVPKLARFVKNAFIEIVTRRDLFPSGSEDLPEVIALFRRRAASAIERGFDGMRVNGSSAGVQHQLSSRSFRQFERQVAQLINGQRLIGISTSPLTFSRASEILEVAELHESALTIRQGVWRRVKITDIRSAEKEIRNTVPELMHLSPRQREILQRIAEGQNTKLVAGILGISIKTVEAHRLQLMRRLKIDNVPGLVRFAIRTGLVSAAA